MGPVTGSVAENKPGGISIAAEAFYPTLSIWPCGTRMPRGNPLSRSD